MSISLNSNLKSSSSKCELKTSADYRLQNKTKSSVEHIFEKPESLPTHRRTNTCPQLNNSKNLSIQPHFKRSKTLIESEILAIHDEKLKQAADSIIKDNSSQSTLDCSQKEIRRKRSDVFKGNRNATSRIAIVPQLVEDLEPIVVTHLESLDKGLCEDKKKLGEAPLNDLEKTQQELKNILKELQSDSTTKPKHSLDPSQKNSFATLKIICDRLNYRNIQKQDKDIRKKQIKAVARIALKGTVLLPVVISSSLLQTSYNITKRSAKSVSKWSKNKLEHLCAIRFNINPGLKKENDENKLYTMRNSKLPYLKKSIINKYTQELDRLKNDAVTYQKALNARRKSEDSIKEINDRIKDLQADLNEYKEKFPESETNLSEKIAKLKESENDFLKKVSSFQQIEMQEIKLLINTAILNLINTNPIVFKRLTLDAALKSISEIQTNIKELEAKVKKRKKYKTIPIRFSLKGIWNDYQQIMVEQRKIKVLN